MTANNFAEALEGVAAAFAFGRMTDEEQDRYLKDLEIRNHREEIKEQNKIITRVRKKIAEQHELGGGVMTPIKMFYLEQDEKNLNAWLSRRADLQSKIKELRK